MVFFFGTCDFVNRKTGELLLNTIPTLKWVAGYSKWVPWLEGTLCDLLFFKLLMYGRFKRPKFNARWEAVVNPEDAAKKLYEVFPMAIDLKFSLFYRSNTGEILSTLEQNEKIGHL